MIVFFKPEGEICRVAVQRVKAFLLSKEEMPWVWRNRKLIDGNVYSRRAFLSLLDVKAHSVAFFETFKTACVDS